MKLVRKQILSCTAVLLCMAIIFVFSSQTAEESSSVSGSVIEIIAPAIYSDFDAMPMVERTQVIEGLQSIVRTCAHGAIYFLLGILTFYAIYSFEVSLRKCLILSVLVCIAYAISDEIHQLFVPGRSMQLIDILVDSIGSLLGASILLFLVSMKKHILQRK